MTLTRKPSEIVASAEASNNPGLLAKHNTWLRVDLGDIAEVLNGAPFSSQYFNMAGDGLPLIRIRDVGVDRPETFYSGPYSTAYLATPGDILIGMDGDFRSSIWRGPISLLNQRVCKISVTNSKMYDDRFLLLAIQGYLDAIWVATSSITVKHLSSRSVAQIPLPLPPLAEQRRIVAVLEDHLSHLDAGAEQVHATLSRIDRYRERYIAAACTGSDRDHHGPSAEPPPFVGVQDGVMPNIPLSWRWARLGEIAEVVGGLTKDVKKQIGSDYQTVPYLRVANVQRRHLDINDVATIRAPKAKIEQLKLQAGDVLLNEGGDRDKLARGWVWEDQLPLCIHQNHVFRARIRDQAIHPRLLAWHANNFGKSWAEANGKQSVNLASISLSKIVG